MLTYYSYNHNWIILLHWTHNPLKFNLYLLIWNKTEGANVEIPTFIVHVIVQRKYWITSIRQEKGYILYFRCMKFTNHLVSNNKYLEYILCRQFVVNAASFLSFNATQKIKVQRPCRNSPLTHRKMGITLTGEVMVNDRST